MYLAAASLNEALNSQRQRHEQAAANHSGEVLRLQTGISDRDVANDQLKATVTDLQARLASHNDHNNQRQRAETELQTTRKRVASLEAEKEGQEKQLKKARMVLEQKKDECARLQREKEELASF